MRGAYLLRTIPLLPLPLLVQQKSVVIIRHHGWGESPRSGEPTTIGMAASESMSTAESNDLLIIEAHSAEDISQVLVTLGRIGKTSIGCASSDVLIQATWTVWDGRALHFLNSADTGEDPEIGVGDPWELLFGKSQQ